MRFATVGVATMSSDANVYQSPKSEGAAEPAVYDRSRFRTELGKRALWASVAAVSAPPLLLLLGTWLLRECKGPLGAWFLVVLATLWGGASTSALLLGAVSLLARARAGAVLVIVLALLESYLFLFLVNVEAREIQKMV
jgi:hypothetical protein